MDPGPLVVHARDFDFSVRTAVTAADLRAAAFLRAISFYHYPEGRSEFAAQVSGGGVGLAGGR